MERERVSGRINIEERYADTCINPELERRLELEAAKRGLQAEEYALRLIEGILEPDNTADVAEQARLAAVDDLMDIAADSTFSSEELRRERNEEREVEEER